MFVGLKYERLPHFCFLCGLMSHTDKDCRIVVEEDREEGNKWSLNIKASPRKRLSKNKKEVEALKGRGKKLFTLKPSLPFVASHMDRYQGDCSFGNALNQATRGGNFVTDSGIDGVEGSAKFHDLD